MARKFKVGDKVRIVYDKENPDGYGDAFIGKVGVVIRDDGSSRFPYEVCVENVGTRYYDPDELAPIAGIEFRPPSPNIAIGDDVIDDLVGRMVSDMKAHISAGGARGDDIRYMGDICVIVTPTRVYKYRLEGVADVEEAN